MSTTSVRMFNQLVYGIVMLLAAALVALLFHSVMIREKVDPLIASVLSIVVFAIIMAAFFGYLAVVLRAKL
jgi:predicted branched-subunit amino acid permease